MSAHAAEGGSNSNRSQAVQETQASQQQHSPVAALARLDAWTTDHSHSTRGDHGHHGGAARSDRNIEPDHQRNHRLRNAQSAGDEENQASRSPRLLGAQWSSNNSSALSLDPDTSFQSTHRSSTGGLGSFNLAALRSRLRHRSTKSTGSRTTLSSQPVLVRAYSGRRSSRPLSPSQYGYATTVFGAAMASDPVPSLPPVSSFTFSHVLLAVSPEIEDVLDAISEICARSRMSLADEYGAHLPPQGEILPGNVPIRRGHAMIVRTSGLAESALSVVPEASSSSGSEAGGMRSAKSSLRNVLSRGRAAVHKKTDTKQRKTRNRLSTSWVVQRDGRQAIVLVSPPEASNQLSVESAADSITVGLSPFEPESTTVIQILKQPSSSWIPWINAGSSPVTITVDAPITRKTAESSLKNLLHPSPIQAQGIR